MKLHLHTARPTSRPVPKTTSHFIRDSIRVKRPLQHSSTTALFSQVLLTRTSRRQHHILQSPKPQIPLNMEGAAAGIAYVAEHVVEAGVALYAGLTRSTAPLSATFTKLKAPSIPRSSHTVSVIGDRVYIFGGEIEPRKPVDASMHILTLPTNVLSDCDYKVVPPAPEPDSSDSETPTARVGHTAAVVGNCIYIFGGRGGPDMSALDEKGRVWVYNTRTDKWSHLDPPPDSQFPEARSYHASTSSPYPSSTHKPDIPGAPTTETTIAGSSTTTNPNAPQAPVDPAPQQISIEPPPESSYGTLIIHAGCLTSGPRTSDVWAFDIASRTWSPLPSAPDPPRGGTSLTMVRERLYRFGGFNGKTEEGGVIDWLDMNISDTSTDKGGFEQPMALNPVVRRDSGMPEWRSDVLNKPESEEENDGPNEVAKTKTSESKPTPANRSVAGLVPVTTGQGREYLLTICGEGEASTIGHAGAGKFFDDVWSFQLKPVGKTAGALKDATRIHLMGKGTGEAEAVEVKYFAGEGSDDIVGAGTKGEAAGIGLSIGEAEGKLVQEGQRKPMQARGWFACSALPDFGRNCALVHGGLDGDNQRLGDTWVISVK